METFFLTNSSFRLVETNFLSKQYYFIQSFVEDFKIREAIFLRKTLFLLVETDFLASGS